MLVKSILGVLDSVSVCSISTGGGGGGNGKATSTCLIVTVSSFQNHYFEDIPLQ
jgi:hypothetical protein